MSKKFILNDNEVVTNEDVEQNDDWRDRNLFRVLEGLLSGLHDSAPTSLGSVQGGAVIAGLTLTASSSSLTVTVTGGTALMAFGGLDSDVTNGFQVCSLEDDTVLTLPAASVTGYRWDLIEVSATQNVTSESRSVLSAGGLSPTTIPKIKENQLTVRVRSGTPNSVRAQAFIPDLEASDAWIPLAAVEVIPGALVADSLTRIDLRKLLSRSGVDDSRLNGPQGAVTIYRPGTVVALPSSSLAVGIFPGKVVLGDYEGPLIPPLGGGSGSQTLVNVEDDIAAGLSPSVTNFFYIYAYRPSSNCGFISAFLSDVPPDISDDIGAPSSSLTLPSPFLTGSTLVAHYLGAIRLYQVGSSFVPRPSRQYRGYVVTTSINTVSSPSGGQTSNQIVAAELVPVGSKTVMFAPVSGPGETIPQHCRTAKVHLSFRASSGPAAVSVNTADDWVVWEMSIADTYSVEAVLDIPLDPEITQQFKIVVTGASLTVSASVLGYYEESV